MRTCFLFLGLYASTLLAQPVWTLTSAPYGARYDDVFFISDTEGWTVSALGSILHTIDGGENWEAQLESEDYFRSIEFLDEETGIASTLNGVIYRTENGGDTWTDISDAFPPEVFGLCGQHALDATTIWGCGNVLQPAFIVHSTDRGQTWDYRDMTGVARYLIDIYFLNADTGFCAGLSNVESLGAVLLKTTDGGATWTEVLHSNTMTDTFWKIYQVNGRSLVLAIENYGTAPARYARSDDRGQTWNIIQIADDPVYCQMIGFMDDSTGYYGNNALLRTQDGGASWSDFPVDTLPFAFNRFFRVRPGLAFVGSAYLYKVEDSTAVPTGIPYTGIPFEPRQWIGAPWPNPSSGQLNLRYGLHFRTRMSLDIHDASGRVVRRLFHGWQNPGEYSLTDNLDLPNGLYTLALYSYDGLTSRPFVIQRTE